MYAFIYRIVTKDSYKYVCLVYPFPWARIEASISGREQRAEKRIKSWNANIKKDTIFFSSLGTILFYRINSKRLARIESLSFFPLFIFISDIQCGKENKKVHESTQGTQIYVYIYTKTVFVISNENNKSDEYVRYWGMNRIGRETTYRRESQRARKR